MPTRKYKFVSPSVQTREVDLTTRPRSRNGIGALVIGRSERGPGLIPVQVESVSDFFETFGEPIAGGGTLNNDIWRDGNYSAPTYGAYAMQAYLKSKGPATFVRLLGDQHENATSAGVAGWPQDGNFTPTTLLSTNAGAYGLFVINSGSYEDFVSNTDSAMTGALAAIFYMKQGSSIRLSGETTYGLNTATVATGQNPELSGSGQLIESTDTDKTFTAIIDEGGSSLTASFNFNEDSNRFIRKVFNTNPILTNSTIIDTSSPNYAKYWLGPSYEDFVVRQVPSGSSAGSVYGVIVPLLSGSAHGGDFQFKGKRSKSGWIFGQDLSLTPAAYMPQNMPKLFRFNSLTAGDWEQKNLKVSISNIKASKNQSDQYGVFDVEIRKVDDNDQSKKVVEYFANCSLNPFAPNYIGKKIGDKYREWNYTKRAYVEYGDYDNNSKFFYVEIAEDVKQALTDPRLLPFGFYGTPRFKKVGMHRRGTTDSTFVSNAGFVRGSGSMPHAPSGSHFGGEGLTMGINDASSILHRLDVDNVTASFAFPKHPLILTASEVNTTKPTDAYFGINVYRNGSTRLLAKNHMDIVRALPENYDEDSTGVETSYYFSLDDVRQYSASSVYYADATYESGSRVLGQSITAIGSVSPLAASSTSSYEVVLDSGFNKFTLPVYGGFDGLDVAEKEPFRNSKTLNGTETTNYAYHSVQRALDAVSDSEVVEYDVAAIPGISNESLTRKLLDICDKRSDALAVIDLEGDYVPPTENTTAESGRRGDVDTTITNLKNRGINNSYGCAFYPWVKIRDTINDNIVDVPPSVVALGTFATTDAKSEPWFAPAGFNRGGLSLGVAGLPVVGVKEKLTKEDRDKLYEANINPIAHFPNEGIVIMGQKTLQVTPSALDRINVRRLMILAKKRISTIAKTLLFDNNVKSTWVRFKGQVEPYLRSIQTRFGLSDFKVVLDQSTTTADLIDRNIMYAKIMLKPARSIEYIAIDFVISNTGASFED